MTVSLATDVIDSLLTSDDVDCALVLYARLLYSKTAAEYVKGAFEQGKASALNARWLATVNYEHLRLEQLSRAGQIRNQIRESCPRVVEFLGDEYTPYVRRFADTEYIWKGLGRNLTESFCLFLYETLRGERHLFLADVARLDGTLAGISSHPLVPTPWSGSVVHYKDEEDGSRSVAEIFPVSSLMLDDSGGLPTIENRDEVAVERPGTLSLVRRQGFDIVVLRMENE
jgi:hypothetical protein